MSVNEPTYSVKEWAEYQHYKDRDPPWVKLHRNLLTGRTWLKGTDQSRVLQVASIALAPRYGNKIPLDFEMLQPAMGLRCSREAFLIAIEHLKSTNFIEINDAPVIIIPVAQVASTALAKCSPEAEAYSEEAEEERISLRSIRARDFDEFWRAWPNRVGKKAALAAYTKARGNASHQQILAGVLAYIENKPAERQWLNPATFLNGERWNDDPASDNNEGFAVGTGAGKPARNRPHPAGIVEVVAGLIAAVTPKPRASSGELFDADDGHPAGGGAEAVDAGREADGAQRMLPAPRQDEVADGEPGRAGDGLSGANSAVRGNADAISGRRDAPRFVNAAEAVEVVASVAGAGGAAGTPHSGPQTHAGRDSESGPVHDLDIPAFLDRRPTQAGLGLGGLETKTGGEAALKRVLGSGPAAKRTLGE